MVFFSFVFQQARYSNSNILALQAIFYQSQKDPDINIYLKGIMPNSQQQHISEQSSNPQLQFVSIQDQVQPQDYSKPNLLDQGFILYSDDEIQSNSQSCTPSLSHSDLSSLSRQSSCSSIENFELNSQSGQFGKYMLKCLNQSNEQSSIYNIHESECSESGIELIHALEPLFDGKLFLRRSKRFAVYGATGQDHMKSEKKVLMMESVDNNDNVDKKQLESEMIEDDKLTSNPPINSARIIEEKYQTPTSIFANNSPPHINDEIPQQKNHQTNPFMRFTRSSKKLTQQQTEINFGTVSKQQNLGIFSSSRESMNDNDYVSRVTKDYILMNRKEKKIKKYQQKQSHGSHALRGLRKRQNTHRLPSI